MICRNCKREIPDNSLFCNWCGEKQLRERKKRDEIKVPSPRQLPSGNWFIQLRAENQSITEATKDLCIAKAKAIRAGFAEAKAKPDNITLSEACTKFIESNRGRLSPSTIWNYEKIRDNDFPYLTAKKLRDITPIMLQEAVNQECKRKSTRTGKTYAPKTVRNNYSFLADVLHHYYPELDTSKIRLPEIKQKPVTILEPKQVFNVVRGTSIELPVLLSMWLSLTMSEIRGLTKSTSISNGQLSIVETVVDIKGKPTRKPGGKEEKRSRTLAIPDYISKLIDAVPGDNIVPLSAQTISKRFYVLLEKAGLPHISFHKLRHINASVMTELNIPGVVQNERGGWKTDYVRNRVYTHTFTPERQAADKVIDAYFENIVTPEKKEITNEITNVP